MSRRTNGKRKVLVTANEIKSNLEKTRAVKQWISLYNYNTTFPCKYVTAFNHTWNKCC